MGLSGPILFGGYRRFVLLCRVGGGEMTPSDPPGAISLAPERRFAGAGANRCGDTRDPLVIDRRRLARVSSIAIALLLPLLLLACKVVETDEQGWHLTTAGIWLLALGVGLPAVIATKRLPQPALPGAEAARLVRLRDRRRRRRWRLQRLERLSQRRRTLSRTIEMLSRPPCAIAASNSARTAAASSSCWSSAAIAAGSSRSLSPSLQIR